MVCSRQVNGYDPSIRQTAYLEAVSWGDAMARSLSTGDDADVKLG
jgi:hypothetical protein